MRRHEQQMELGPCTLCSLGIVYSWSSKRILNPTGAHAEQEQSFGRRLRENESRHLGGSLPRIYIGSVLVVQFLSIPKSLR